MRFQDLLKKLVNKHEENKEYEVQLEIAHRYSANNKNQLAADKLCGCFYCLEIFDPTEI